MYFTSSCRDRSADMSNGMYEEFTSVSCYFCYGLFLIGKDGFETREMAGVWELPAGHKATEDTFY